MRQNRFKSVAGLVGSLGTKQNDKSGIFRLTENLKVSDYMMFLLIPYVRKNEMIDLDVEIYQHLNEQIKINKLCYLSSGDDSDTFYVMNNML